METIVLVAAFIVFLLSLVLFLNKESNDFSKFLAVVEDTKTNVNAVENSQKTFAKQTVEQLATLNTKVAQVEARQPQIIRFQAVIRDARDLPKGIPKKKTPLLDRAGITQ